jgi:hypothetical protein
MKATTVKTAAPIIIPSHAALADESLTAMHP